MTRTIAFGWLLLVTLPLPGALPAQETDRVKYDRNRITAEEVTAKALDATTAYDIVHRLRPHLLHPRPASTGLAHQRARQQRSRDATIVELQVFVDGALKGGLSVLHEIAAYSVVEILYLNGTDATTRFGTGYEGGAMLVTTGRRPQG